jgi:hypothetical protein
MIFILLLTVGFVYELGKGVDIGPRGWGKVRISQGVTLQRNFRMHKKPVLSISSPCSLLVLVNSSLGLMPP